MANIEYKENAEYARWLLGRQMKFDSSCPSGQSFLPSQILEALIFWAFSTSQKNKFVVIVLWSHHWLPWGFSSKTLNSKLFSNLTPFNEHWHWRSSVLHPIQFQCIFFVSMSVNLLTILVTVLFLSFLDFKGQTLVAAFVWAASSWVTTWRVEWNFG